MSRKCVVPGCNNSDFNKSKVHFYGFPSQVKDKSRFDAWMANIQPREEITNWSKVCCEHFEKSCYQTQILTLKRHAVPTLFGFDALLNENSMKKLHSCNCPSRFKVCGFCGLICNACASSWLLKMRNFL